MYLLQLKHSGITVFKELIKTQIILCVSKLESSTFEWKI